MERSGTGPDEQGYMQAPPEAFHRLIQKDPTARWMLREPLLRVDAYREVFDTVQATARWARESGEEADVPDGHQISMESPAASPPAEDPGEGLTADTGPFTGPPPVQGPRTQSTQGSSSLPSSTPGSRRKSPTKRSSLASFDGEDLQAAARTLISDSAAGTLADIRAAARIVMHLDGLTLAQRFRASAKIISDPLQALIFLEQDEEHRVDYLLALLDDDFGPRSNV